MGNNGLQNVLSVLKLYIYIYILADTTDIDITDKSTVTLQWVKKAKRDRQLWYS